MVDNKRQLYEGTHIKDFRELVERYELFGDKTAFEYKLDPKSEILKISYTQYIQDIKAIGTSLLNLGLFQKKVAIISPNRYEWCVSYLGVTTSDMVVVPLDKSLPSNEIEGLIIRSGANAVIYDQEYTEVFNKLKQEGKSNLDFYICMDSLQDKDGILSYQTLLQNGTMLLEKGDTRYDEITLDNEKMAVMLFTSGTTSISKAVALSQKNICSDIYSLSCMAKVTKEDTFLSFLPLHHTFESTCTFLYGTSCGITIAFCDGLKYVAKNLDDYKITGFVCVPLMLEIMYKKITKEVEKQGKTNLVKTMSKVCNFLLKFGIDIRRTVFKQILESLGGHLRLLIAGGAPMSKETIEGFLALGINLLQGYGLTETSPVLAGENDRHKKTGSVGFALPDIDIKIDHPNEEGIGEIIAKGPTIMLGYCDNQEATDKVIIDGWFHTGDLGYIDHDGFLFITGREKDVIVLKNGKNIYPEEIEILINRLPFISESIVYGTPDKDGDLTLCAKVVYNKEAIEEQYPNTPETEFKTIIWDKIKEINHTMPAYKYIRELTITTEGLIKTTTQKLKRNEEIKRIFNEKNNS